MSNDSVEKEDAQVSRKKDNNIEDETDVTNDSQDVLCKLTNKDTLSIDPEYRISEIRLRIKQTRRPGIDRKTRSEIVQVLTPELVKTEKMLIESEVKKVELLIRASHDAFKTNLLQAWMEFLKNVKAKLVGQGDKFAEDWMVYSTARIQEVKSNSGLTDKQKENMYNRINDREEKMLKEIDGMVDNLLTRNKAFADEVSKL